MFLAACLHAADLRVCADPNNLPFSNRSRQGFENRLADLLGSDLGATVHYTWWLQRRNFLRNTLQAGRCDVVLGVPAGAEGILTTRPYYHSSYALVYRSNRNLGIRSLSDPALEHLKIGVHVVDDNYAPPAGVLAERGIISNIVGFSLYGARSESNPPAAIFDALDRGAIDVAVVWGPLAGYYAGLRGRQLTVVLLRDSVSHRSIPLSYAISIGVRRDRRDLKAAIEQALDRDRARVDGILASYGVPRVHGI